MGKELCEHVLTTGTISGVAPLTRRERNRVNRCVWGGDLSNNVVNELGGGGCQ